MQIQSLRIFLLTPRVGTVTACTMRADSRPNPSSPNAKLRKENPHA